jgi:hypothetical protein
MPLHLTKVAFGAQSLDEIRTWFAGRGDEARLTTRNLPKRADEIAPGNGSGGGEHGSLFWIYKHQLVARSPILRFEPAPERRTHIVIEARMILLHPQARRAHQGWRYLEAADAPADLGAGEDPGEALPADLASELARLGLV